MEFDIKKTLELVKNGLLNPEGTWNSFLEENPEWQKTLILLTGPVLLASVVLNVIFSRMLGGYGAYAVGGNIVTALLIGLITAIAGFILFVFIASFFAGKFGGTSDFSRAFAAVSLAAIPAWLASIAAAIIPWLGVFVSIAGAIWSLVLLYKIFPLALGVPQEKRVVHFVVTLIVTVVCNVILGTLLVFGGLRPDMTTSSLGSRDSTTNRIGEDVTSGTGIFGEAQRQAELMQSASQDRYEPPDDGEVTEEQVQALVSVIEKSQAALADRAERLKRTSEDLEDGEIDSPADLMTMYQGMGAAVSLQNVEMEVVKTGGGNWAEYRWVKEQLRIAKLQMGSGSDALEHNYELYTEYEDQLGDVL